MSALARTLVFAILSCHLIKHQILQFFFTNVTEHWLSITINSCFNRQTSRDETTYSKSGLPRLCHFTCIVIELNKATVAV